MSEVILLTLELNQLEIEKQTNSRIFTGEKNHKEQSRNKREKMMKTTAKFSNTKGEHLEIINKTDKS